MASSSFITLVSLLSKTWNSSHTKQVLRAEALWALKVALGNFSYSSCDGISDLFQEMFLSDPISKDFMLSSSKVSNLISHGLGPHFYNLLVEDIKRVLFYTFEVDETTIKQIKKSLIYTYDFGVKLLIVFLYAL